jgi:hypothetical protein
MFKKISHIVFSVLLLVSTMGMIISKHYCGGSLISTSVFNEAESCCGESDCCSNETDFYQVDEDYSLVAYSEIPITSEVDLIGFALLVDSFDELMIGEEHIFITAESPPPPPIHLTLSKKQVYLL